MASVSKKTKRLVSYDPAWEKKFPISCVANNKNSFYCIPCKKAVSCGHVGKVMVRGTVTQRQILSIIKM